METIICAAIWYRDNIAYVHQPKNILEGYVVCGRRHHNCFTTHWILAKNTGSNNKVQGFVTSEDRFVNRQEAYTIAFNASQIIGPNRGQPNNSIGLTSEDLY